MDQPSGELETAFRGLDRVASLMFNSHLTSSALIENNHQQRSNWAGLCQSRNDADKHTRADTCLNTVVSSLTVLSLDGRGGWLKDDDLFGLCSAAVEPVVAAHHAFEPNLSPARFHVSEEVLVPKLV